MSQDLLVDESQELGPYKVTPMMNQWQSCKAIAKDALLLFRMGDFYEAFYDDAITLSKELDVVLTQRQGIPMSGVPWHTCDGYIDRLVTKGFRVAIAEQTEDPKEAKGLVKREVVRVITPGTVINSMLLKDKSNNFLISLSQVGALLGLAVIDLTTGEFRTIEFEDVKELYSEIYRLQPSEVLTSSRFKTKHESLFKELALHVNPLITIEEEWRFDHESATNTLTRHFKIHSLDGYGLKAMVAAINSAGALLAYLKEKLCLSVDHVQTLTPYSLGQFLLIDPMTQRNLELMDSSKDEHRKTLFSLLDHTETPMGGRLLRQWLKNPLLSIKEIEKRQSCVKELLSFKERVVLKQTLARVRDLERLMMKICSGNSTPRDVKALSHSLNPLGSIKQRLSILSSPLFVELYQNIDALPELTAILEAALNEELPLRIGEGSIFKFGFNKELDELKTLSQSGQQWLLNYQQRLKDETGIKTLKVSYNKIFGFYIEVSKGQADKMPVIFHRRQTLVNSERFISPELKEYEDKVLSAEERMVQLEERLFKDLLERIKRDTDAIMRSAKALSVIDCLLSFATSAERYNYRCPRVNDSMRLLIKEGRHPLVEDVVGRDKYIANDTYLDEQDPRMGVITGPNMAGKSTYLRQVALIVILAQMGSFVPAAEAEIGIIDKIFTRIGASDDLARGQSTFMVEMAETAQILNNATHRSLVILDEIGRGTSTFDGISIAWAVADYLLTQEGRQAKTLFATHYWELTALEEQYSGVKNFNVSIREWNDEIIFLHKIIPGKADKSYGIHVARLAGLPSAVIHLAQKMLSKLESDQKIAGSTTPSSLTKGRKLRSSKDEVQLLLFDSAKSPDKENFLAERLLAEMKKLDLNAMTPLQALLKLEEMKQLIDHGL